MAELSKDIILKLDMGDLGLDDRRMLERLLEGAEHITAFTFLDDNKLVVSLQPTGGEDELTRLLAATGLYPASFDQMGRSAHGGADAC